MIDKNKIPVMEDGASYLQTIADVFPNGVFSLNGEDIRYTFEDGSYFLQKNDWPEICFYSEPNEKPILCPVSDRIFNKQNSLVSFGNKEYIESSIELLDEKRKLIVKNYITHLREHFSKPPWIYVHGATGTGKTFFTYALVKEILESGKGLFVRWYNSNEILSTIRKSFSQDDDGNDARETLKSLSGEDGERPYVLVIDDIGADKLSEIVMPEFLRIINGRYERGYPTIFTSNFSIEDLQKVIDQRIVSRIMGLSQVFHFSSKNYRIEKNANNIDLLSTEEEL